MDSNEDNPDGLIASAVVAGLVVVCNPQQVTTTPVVTATATATVTTTAPRVSVLCQMITNRSQDMAPQHAALYDTGAALKVRELRLYFERQRRDEQEAQYGSGRTWTRRHSIGSVCDAQAMLIEPESDDEDVTDVEAESDDDHDDAQELGSEMTQDVPRTAAFYEQAKADDEPATSVSTCTSTAERPSVSVKPPCSRLPVPKITAKHRLSSGSASSFQSASTRTDFGWKVLPPPSSPAMVQPLGGDQLRESKLRRPRVTGRADIARRVRAKRFEPSAITATAKVDSNGYGPRRVPPLEDLQARWRQNARKLRESVARASSKAMRYEQLASYQLRQAEAAQRRAARGARSTARVGFSSG